MTKSSTLSFARMGKLLQNGRTKAGFSQREVAETLGYGTAQVVSDWERGTRSPPLNIIKKLVKLYHIPAETFFDVLLAERSAILESKLRKDLGIRRA